MTPERLAGLERITERETTPGTYAERQLLADLRQASFELVAEVRRLQAENAESLEIPLSVLREAKAIDQAVLDAAEAWTDDWMKALDLRSAVQARREARGKE